jgi:hypothetical protein
MMASEELHLFPDETTVGQLMAHVVGQTALKSTATSTSADLSGIGSAVNGLKAAGGKRAAWDAKLVAPVHAALKGVPRSLQLNPQFWEWLAAERFRDLVWERWWDGNPPKDFAEAQVQPPSKWRRFECRRTMNGMSRNAISRLFWAGELLVTGNDYSLAEAMFGKQEIQQQIFDRLFGLHAPAAKAFVKTCIGKTDDQVQKLGERLNEYASTIAVEFLDENEIESLLV